MVPRFEDINILQTVEIDPDKKYVIHFGADFERAVIRNINIDPDQFKNGVNSPEAQAVIKKIAESQFNGKVKELQKALNEFAEDPAVPFYMIHLGGKDFIKIKSSKKEDQEKVFEVEKDEGE